jgi:ABC-type transport system involved in cytochrome bd biosynthesis fused ATPase/permease subunit
VNWAPSRTLRTATTRGAPDQRAVVRAITAGAGAQLLGVVLVGGATGLLTWAARRPSLGAIAGLLVAVELAAFLRAPLRHVARHASHDLGLGGLRGWRIWLLESVATWSPSRLAAARAGDLLTRCLEDADAIQDLWVRVLVPTGSTLVALAAASVIVAGIAPLAGLALALATTVVATGAWRSSRSICVAGAEEAELRGAIAARVVEFVHGANTLVLLGADASHVGATTSLIHRADALAAHRDAIVSRLSLLAAVASGLALVATALSVPLTYADPAAYTGVLLAVLASGELLVSLPLTLEPLGPIAGAAVRLEQLADDLPTGTMPAQRGALRLAGVGVAASAVGPLLVEDVTLAVEPATSVAVHGPTGSGKSSLLAVAARLEARRGGTITLGDVELDQLDEESLRRSVAWLPDAPGLLEGRVRDVLDVGRRLGDEVLASSLDRVGLTETLRERGGLDAVLGSRGSELSGGERQRLALARVLAGSPDLFVLDEPTAGLDAQSVTIVLDALDESHAGVLVATHDAQVVAWAHDRRAVVDGRLASLPLE